MHNFNFQVGDLVKFKLNSEGTRTLYHHGLFLVQDIQQFEKAVDLEDLLSGEEVEGKEWNVLLYEFNINKSYWWNRLERFKKVSK